MPNLDDVVIFDGNSLGDCTIGSPVDVAGVRLSAFFDGTIFQAAPLSILGDPSGLMINGGALLGGSSSDITVKGLYLGSTGQFRNTDATLHLTGISTFGSSWVDAGTVAFHSGSAITLNNANIGRIQAMDGSGQYSTLIGSCTTGSLVLTSGRLKKGSSDQTVTLRGDLRCQASYGSWDNRNDAYVLMDASGPQSILNEAGGIISCLTVDKTTENPVSCYGTGPIMINGDFVLADGTFNTNGLSLQVGA